MNKLVFYSLLIVVASSMYGILSTIIKLAMQAGFTSSEAITSQYLFGFLIILCVYVLFDRSKPKLTKKGFLTIFCTSIFTTITGVVYGHSLNYLPASLAVVLLFQFTWIGMLIDCIRRKRLPSHVEGLSLIVLFVGTIFAAGLIDADLSNIPTIGWVLGLLSAISFAFFIQFNSIPVEGVTSISRTLIVSIIAFTIISLILSPEIIWNGQLTNGLWKYGLILGTFGIVFPVLLLSIAVPKVGGGLASILSAMELPVAIIVSVVLLHETLTSLQIIGIALVLFGMTLPSLAVMRKKQIQSDSR